uniref:Uncharacterized protein n=1 Tax=Candidatus Kentrum eta TaxID=2126337 RepID=A0A450VLH3_9GAMM|nr:MAG: hypothetical protein BECKH772B_GA0070898_104143 [Candidatus Kentron sp. H]VFK04389.1 MAG: hypothetical protein BECKH772A_GA0070896_104103 [Candidatus Kentron sp. H]VFK05155.1 MAG: hypothetical protein BECKH772B_GA0070898_105411 [Candidatus Kentron sp. H]VFK05652.1 MAG: hypothetical protein BECKH772A_GA0070896_105761 [Candidatus Kentron sp. H]VFK07439.1 MAG: hypothetical protein BECKH772C_GA0070978_104203 [Candidatus Kentron sp. H]
MPFTQIFLHSQATAFRRWSIHFFRPSSLTISLTRLAISPLKTFFLYFVTYTDMQMSRIHRMRTVSAFSAHTANLNSLKLSPKWRGVFSTWETIKTKILP